MLQDDVFIHTNLLNLQEITVAQCQLHTVDRHAFRDLINLVKLDLAKNQLIVVPSHAFAFATGLRELRLTGNPIRKLGNYAFSALAQLVKLDLSECGLVHLEPRSLSGLDSLESLRLDKNMLTVLHPTALLPLKGLHGISLGGNPWNCTCDLRPTREWMASNNVASTSDPPVCSSPSRLRDNLWHSLDLEEFACHPLVVSKAKTLSLNAGSKNELWNVTLNCEVESNPEPSISWFRGGQTRVPIVNGSVLGDGPSFFIVQWGRRQKSSNLTIVDAGAGAEAGGVGEYICTGSNKAGHVSSKVNVVLAKPVVTTTLHKRESSAASATSDIGGKNQLYVVAALGGGIVIFVTLFVACCVFSATQKPVVLRSRYFKTASAASENIDDSVSMAKKSASFRNSTDDDLASADITELTRLHDSSKSDDINSFEMADLKKSAEEEEDKFDQQFQQGFHSNGYHRIPAIMEHRNASIESKNHQHSDLNSGSDEGYRSLSSYTNSSQTTSPPPPPLPSREAAVRSMPPPLPLKAENLSSAYYNRSQTNRGQYEPEYSNRSEVDRESPYAGVPMRRPLPLLPTTSTSDFSRRDAYYSERPRRRPQRRPFSDTFVNVMSTSGSGGHSPRVRFNLEPIHFEAEDLDQQRDDVLPLKMRERSPSDPLITFAGTLEEDGFHHRRGGHESASARRVRFKTSRSGAGGEPMHTCGKFSASSGVTSSIDLSNNSNSRPQQQPHQRWSFNEDFYSGGASYYNSYTSGQSSHRGQPFSSPASAQMGAFFHEYRSLQSELMRMREACDNLRHANLRGELESLKATVYNRSNKAGFTKATPKPILKNSSQDSPRSSSVEDSEAVRGQHANNYHQRSLDQHQPPLHNRQRRLLPQPQVRYY